MVGLLILERPDPNQVGDGNAGVQGPQIRRQRVELVRWVHDVDRPTGPGARHHRDVILVVAIIHSEGEQFQQFAGVVLVGDSSAVAPAVIGVEVDDHRRAFGADAQEIVKRALRIQEGLAPALVLFEFKLGGQLGHSVGVVVESVEVISRLGVLSDKMIFQELVQDFE